MAFIARSHSQIAASMSRLHLITSVCFVLLAGIWVSAAPIPLAGSSPVDVGQIKAGNPAVLSTDGIWRFQISHGMMDGNSYVTSAISASSAQNAPTYALDGNSETRWCASNASMPQWLQVDLGTAQDVVGLQLAWEYGDGHYRFKAETSNDAEHWHALLDQTAAPGKGDGNYEFPPTSAKFIRITVTGATDSKAEPKWASIRELKIIVMKDGKRVDWSPKTAAQGPQDSNAFAATSFDDRDWHDLTVPSNWEVAGYSKPTYGNADTSVGLYRRWMDIPADFAGKKILWHFDGVTESAEIFVNGQRVGYHEGGFTAFDIDLTSAIKAGVANLLAVRVCKTTPTVDLDTGDYWLLGGIHRESYLVALPQTYFNDITVVTDLDATYTNATLKADTEVKGAAGDRVSITGTLYDFQGKRVETPTLQSPGTIAVDGSIHIHLQSPITKPKLWSAEKPNLYYLLFTLQKNGATIETIEQRFGFRQVEIKDETLLWNGVPIKCTGVCRHEEWSALGHALTEHEWQTDVAMMKAANINAVRTSHYNHAQRFLELCEEKGLYVLDEIPACWVDPKDPKLKSAFVQHAVETLARDKNRPCVLAWSCGNESGWGPNFKAMADYVATTDPTRPRFVSCCPKSDDPVLSFNDYHYPQDASLNKIATGPGPSVLTEGPHIFYVKPGQLYDYGVNDLWGEALAATWNRVWPSKPIFGAFIWEWQDQGLADKYPDRTNVDPSGLRSDNHKGIVTGYRVPKPEYYHVKMVYSPVTVDAHEVQADGQNLAVEVQNRYAFTDLSELTCRWQALGTLQQDRILAEGETHPACAPRTNTTLRFPVSPGMDTLRLEFIHPDGRSIYSTRLHIAGTPQPAAPPALAEGAPLRCEATDRIVRISNAIASLEVDTQTGRIVLTRAGDAAPMLTGPVLNLGELRVDDKDFLDRNEPPWIGSQSPPLLTNCKVIASADGASNIVRISINSDVSLTESPRVLAKLTYIMCVHPNWQIDVSYQLRWVTTDCQAWELGLKFQLPQSYDTLSWLRQGQWTEYPADHIGAACGTAKRSDLSFRCTKRNVIWSTLDSESSGGLDILADGTPLHVRAQTDGDITTLFASSRVSPPRDFSWNYLSQYRILLKQGQTYDGAFILRLVPTGNKNLAAKHPAGET
jgi:beta-galactosidase